MYLKRKDFIFILLLLSLFIVFFGTLIFTDVTFHYRDIAKYYYPIKFFTTESIQNGQIPFWNPYLFCGNPFLATLQHGLFYPLSLLYYFLPFNLGFKYFFIIHLFLAGLFLYLLMRKLKVDSYCSFMTAVIFIFSGYLISLVNLLTTLCAVIWAPLIFLFFNQAVQKKSYFFSLLVGIILSFQFFAGQPEVVYMTILILGFYLAFHIFYFTLYLSNSAGFIKRKTKKVFQEMRKTLLIFILSLAILFLISIIQSIPFWELIKHSSRMSGIFFKEAVYWSLHPLELVTLVIPSFSWNFMSIENWFKQYWLRTVFIGIWPIILVVLALRFKQNYKNRIFFFSLGIFSLILSLGRYTPLYYILYKYVPGFNLIRYPVKFMFLVAFSFVILSGMGLQYLIDQLREKKNLVKSMKTLVVMFIFLLAGLIFFYFTQTQISAILTKYLSGQLSSLEFVRLRSIYLTRIIQGYSSLIIFLGIGILLIFLTFKNKLKLKNFQFLFGIIIFANLSLVNFNKEPIVKTRFYQVKGEIVKYLQGEGRVFLTPKTFQELTQTKVVSNYRSSPDMYIDRKALLLPNIGWIYHLFDAGGYATMHLNRYRDFMIMVKTQPAPSSSYAIDLLGVRYLISLWELDDPSLISYATINYVKIYKNKNSLPRVSVISHATFIYGEQEVKRKMGQSEFNPAKEVIIEPQTSCFSNQVKSPVTTNLPSFLPLLGERIKVRGRVEAQVSEHQLQNLADGQGKARITCYNSNEVGIEAELSHPGWLLLTDTYYPGWKVYIDGQQGKIYKADYLFRGVYLNSGNHKVKFVYEPTLFRAGLSMTLLTILGLGIAGTYYLNSLRRQRNKTTDGQNAKS